MADLEGYVISCDVVDKIQKTVNIVVNWERDEFIVLFDNDAKLISFPTKMIKKIIDTSYQEYAQKISRKEDKSVK